MGFFIGCKTARRIKVGNAHFFVWSSCLFVRDMRQQDKWQQIINPILENTPYELVGVESAGGGKHALIRIYVDKPGGITIDDIVKLTRDINVVLEVEQPIKGLYTLEVSSPGIERPLFSPQHFKKHVGKKVTIKISHALDNRQNFKGVLQQANDEGIQLEENGQLFSFTYTEIDKAKVIPDIVIGSGSKKALNKNDQE